jgi:hypothetical protein
LGKAITELIKCQSLPPWAHERDAKPVSQALPLEIDGLAQTTDGSSAQRSCLEDFIWIAGYKDDGHVEAKAGQMILKIKTAHCWHLDVQY